MIEKYHRFQRKEKLTLERAQDLRASYRSMEQSGHSKLNEVRGVATELEEKWAWFEEEMKHRLVNLEMALKFQRTLFQVSTHLMKTDVERVILACITSGQFWTDYNPSSLLTVAIERPHPYLLQ